MNRLLLIIVFSLMCLTLNARPDNLEPEEGIFSISSAKDLDDYYGIVRKVLLRGMEYDEDRRIGDNLLRIIVLPSFAHEYLLSVDRVEANTILTYQSPKQILWSYPGIDPKSDTVTCNRIQINFDAALASQIQQLFILAISQVRYPDVVPGRISIGLDGTNYHFMTYRRESGLMSGRIWSPDGPKLKGLVEVSDWLVECALKGEIVHKEAMTGRIVAITQMFAN